MDSEEELDDNDNRGITSIITSNEMLKVGLEIGGWIVGNRSIVNDSSLPPSVC
jgi:hypothetical protein